MGWGDALWVQGGSPASVPLKPKLDTLFHGPVWARKDMTCTERDHPLWLLCHGVGGQANPSLSGHVPSIDGTKLCAEGQAWVDSVA